MRWVLYLNNGMQVLYRVERKAAFPVWRGEGVPLAGRPKEWRCGGVAVIVDLMEEEYRLERLPHLGGRDGQALWQRKQRQLFQDEPYVSVIRMGREKTGRRDDRLLFSAIREVALFKEWMETLDRWGMPVSGIWSQPRLSARWRAYPLENGLRVLLYSCGGKIALRQNYHQDGRLVFSRLSLVAGEGEGGQELERTWRYLTRQFQLEPGKALRLQIWAAAGREEMARGVAQGLPGSDPLYIGLPDAATAMGWRGDASDLEAPALAAFILARGWSWQPSHYRDPDHQAREKRRRLNLALYGGRWLWLPWR